MLGLLGTQGGVGGGAGSPLPSEQHGYAGLPRLDEAGVHRRRETVFLVLAGLFIGTLAMLNILGISRFLVIGSWGPLGGDGGDGWQWLKPNFASSWTFAVAVGVLPYPLTFLCTDLISELYGRARANAVVFVGLLVNLWVALILWVGGLVPGFEPLVDETHMPPLPVFDEATGVYKENGWTFFQIRRLAFSAMLASMIAYMAAQFVDVQLYHFWKRLTKGRHLWLRNNASTAVSQFVDTAAVILITHFIAKALPIVEGPVWPQLAVFIATGYAFKLLVAMLDTGPMYLAAGWLRRYLRLGPARG